MKSEHTRNIGGCHFERMVQRMIREYKNTLHIKLDKETLKAIKDGYWSAEWACMEFLATNARSCDFDDVDDVTIINGRFVIEDFGELAEGKTLIVPECSNIDDYIDWWKL